MKKISLLLILILCVTFFSGCFNANSATLATVYANYQSLLSAYPYTETGNIKMFNGQKKYDLYSSGAYSASVYQAIQMGSEENFDLLKQGNEYEVLLSAAMNFFYNNVQVLDLTINNEKVPQELRTQLFIALEDLTAKTRQVYLDKLSMETICQDNFSRSDIIINNSLKAYLKSYSNLIGSAIKFNLIFSDICLNYINDYNITSSTSVYTGGVSQLVMSAQLHIANYLYQKYMVFNTDVTQEFRSEILFYRLNTLIDLYNDNDVDYNAYNNDATTIVYFKRALQMQSHFDVEFGNLSTAISKLNNTVPEADSSNYYYYTYLINYETNCQTYLDFVLTITHMIIDI